MIAPGHFRCVSNLLFVWNKYFIKICADKFADCLFVADAFISRHGIAGSVFMIPTGSKRTKIALRVDYDAKHRFAVFV